MDDLNTLPLFEPKPCAVPFAEPKVQILVVDDRIENLTVLEAMLSGGDLRLIHTRSGREALSEAAISEFAAILLDVQMPGMDGFETAQLIRKSGRNQSTPIIFLTANDRDDFVDRGYEVGAIDYLIKPVKPLALRAKVQFFVELYKRGKALEQSHLRGRHAFLEHTLDAVVAVDEFNQVTFWNPQAEAVFGYSAAEAHAQILSEIIIPERFRGLHEAGMKQFRETRFGPILNKRIEVTAIRKNGEEFPAELTVTPVDSSDGTLFYSYIRDISDRKRAVAIEQDRNLLERRFRTIFAQSPVPFIMFSPAGKILVANDAWTKAFGIDPMTVPDYNIFDDQHAEAMGVLSKLRRTFAGETVIVPAFEYDPAVVNREGSARWMEGAAFPVRAKCGTIQEIALFVRDVTEQMQATSTLARVTATIPALLSYIDRHGRYQFVNDTYLEWLGKDSASMLGKTVAEVFGQEFHQARAEEIRAVLAGQSVRFESTLDHLVHGTLVTEHLFTPDFDEKGNVRGFVALVQDVTQRNEAARQLRESKDEAERANELKSAFLANMSHEIRTPLGAMIGFADLLRDPELSAGERSSYLDILGRNGEQLGHIINDILDLSKVEAGHMVMEHSIVGIRQIANEVISLFSVKSREKGLSLDLVIDDSTYDQIATDPTRLKQILFNMVGNAIKFTSRGKVQLRLASRTIGSELHALFEVSDTGIGVPADRIDQIFEVFVQADGSVTRRFGGTGLGLALSRKLARALGGDVKLKTTRIGHGTSFEVSIPDQREKVAAPIRPNASAGLYAAPIGDHLLDGIRVLVVDDAADNRHLISRYLSKQGAHIELAENGLEGAMRAMKEDFDVVIMDIQMPVMDGYTAIQMLREQGYDRPVIALTAHAMSEVRKKCLNVGATDHLTKPINAKSLIAAVARLAQPQREAQCL